MKKQLKTLILKNEEKYKKLLIAAIETLNENLHLCDGDVCTLKSLRDAVAEIEPNWYKE